MYFGFLVSPAQDMSVAVHHFSLISAASSVDQWSGEQRYIEAENEGRMSAELLLPLQPKEVVLFQDITFLYNQTAFFGFAQDPN